MGVINHLEQDNPRMEMISRIGRHLAIKGFIAWG